jgi:hypothetical protein
VDNNFTAWSIAPVVDRPADRRATAEQLPRSLVDGIGKLEHRSCVLDLSPRNHLHLLVIPGPLRHRHRDPAGRARADRLQQPRIAKGRGITSLLEDEAFVADTARRVDGKHELKVDDRLRSCWSGQERKCRSQRCQ